MDHEQGLKSEAPEHASHLLAARLDHLESRLGREVDYHHLQFSSVLVTFHLSIVIIPSSKGELEERLLGLERRLEEVKNLTDDHLSMITYE